MNKQAELNQAFLTGYMDKRASISLLLNTALVSPFIGSGIGGLMANEGQRWAGAGIGALEGLGTGIGIGTGSIAGGLTGLIGGGVNTGKKILKNPSMSNEEMLSGITGPMMLGSYGGAALGGGAGWGLSHLLAKGIIGDKRMEEIFGDNN